MIKRVFLIVMDSFGCGEAPDASLFNDEGSNTLKTCYMSPKFNAPNLKKLGLLNIDNIGVEDKIEKPIGSFCKIQERSKGKDTTTGHWEIAGIVSPKAMPTYPNGFSQNLMNKMTKVWKRGYLVNKPYSGTDLLMDYGREHVETGKLLVYTSADSVFQIAAHEDVVPLKELYKYCRQARKLLKGRNSVSRVIARPFVGEYPNFERTPNRHDFSVKPPRKTLLDVLRKNGKRVISVGKIADIFANCGIDEGYRTIDNNHGMDVTIELQNKDFEGLCFVNLVDFDAKYGHRNNIEGYAQAVTDFDKKLGKFMKNMRDEDLLIITADHGCDPSTPSTDHSREYIPMLAYGKDIKPNNNLGTKKGFCCIARTILDVFDIKDKKLDGTSFYNEIIK